jgi:hypothetical protein
MEGWNRTRKTENGKGNPVKKSKKRIQKRREAKKEG